MRYNSDALGRLAGKLLSGKSKYDELKEIANRQNYLHKVQKLKERLTEDLKFWIAKGTSNRLADIEKDIRYISGVLNKKEFTKQEKEKIDELVKKHPIK